MSKPARVVCVADRDDPETRLLIDALRHRGSEVTELWIGVDESSIDVDLTLSDFEISQDGTSLTPRVFAEAEYVIFRRWRMAETSIVASTLDDVGHRRFAEREWAATFTACLSMAERVSGAARWLNSPSSRLATRDKLGLLAACEAAGLTVPPLRVSTTLAAPVDGPVVAKAINVDEAIDEERRFATTELDTAALTDHVGTRMPLPSLLQQRVDADYELRVLAGLGSSYSVRLDADGPSVDIRYGSAGSLRTQPWECPREVESRLLAVNRRVGLGLCAFDVLVSANRHYVVDATPDGLWSPYSAGDEAASWLADRLTSRVAPGSWGSR